MADFSIKITIPDDKVSELVAALRSHYGQKVEKISDADGVRVTRSEYTPAELKQCFAKQVRQMLRSIHEEHMLKGVSVAKINVTE